MQYFRNPAGITLCAMALLAVSPARAADPPPSAPAPSPVEAGRLALKLLASALRDGDADTRAASAVAWGQTGNPAAVPVLRKTLRDKNARVRVEAAYSLHLLGS